MSQKRLNLTPKGHIYRPSLPSVLHTWSAPAPGRLCAYKVYLFFTFSQKMRLLNLALPCRKFLKNKKNVFESSLHRATFLTPRSRGHSRSLWGIYMVRLRNRQNRITFFISSLFHSGICTDCAWLDASAEAEMLLMLVLDMWRRRTDSTQQALSCVLTTVLIVYQTTPNKWCLYDVGRVHDDGYWQTLVQSAEEILLIHPRTQTRFMFQRSRAGHLMPWCYYIGQHGMAYRKTCTVRPEPSVRQYELLTTCASNQLTGKDITHLTHGCHFRPAGSEYACVKLALQIIKSKTRCLIGLIATQSAIFYSTTTLPWTS